VTLLPAATDVGDAEFVTTRSACVAVATTSAAVAVLFEVFGSVMEELTVAVSLIAVPAAVPAFTRTVYVIVADPGAKLELEQVRVTTLQLHVPVAVSVCAVVLAGRVSVRFAFVAVLGPLFVTTCVYVIVLFACTGTGLGLLVTERSAVLATSVVTVTLLLLEFGSAVVEETEAVCVRFVPDATVEGTVTTKVRVAVVFAPMFVVSVHLRVIREQFQPAPESETAVVPAGRVSESTGAFAVACPALVTDCVYVMLFPAVTGFGLPTFVTLRSACVPEPTGMFTVAKLLAAFVSRVVVATVTVSAMIVPPAVAAFTR